MAREFGPTLRTSCAFVSQTVLAQRVLPPIEDRLPATRTRKVCRHSDTGYAGNVPAATQKPDTGLLAPSAFIDSGAWIEQRQPATFLGPARRGSFQVCGHCEHD